MDLSVQKMQPPATVKGKSAAKKTDPSGSEDAVETITRDQVVHMDRATLAMKSLILTITSPLRATSAKRVARTVNCSRAKT